MRLCLRVSQTLPLTSTEPLANPRAAWKALTFPVSPARPQQPECTYENCEHRHSQSQPRRSWGTHGSGDPQGAQGQPWLRHQGHTSLGEDGAPSSLTSLPPCSELQPCFSSQVTAGGVTLIGKRVVELEGQNVVNFNLSVFLAPIKCLGKQATVYNSIKLTQSFLLWYFPNIALKSIFTTPLLHRIQVGYGHHGNPCCGKTLLEFLMGLVPFLKLLLLFLNTQKSLF